MKSCSEYRTAARQALAKKWVIASLAALVLTFVEGSMSGLSQLVSTVTDQSSVKDSLAENPALAVVLLALVSITLVLSICWGIFVSSPLRYSTSVVFLDNQRTGGFVFENLWQKLLPVYMPVVKAMLWAMLIVVAWVLVPVVVAVVLAFMAFALAGVGTVATTVIGVILGVLAAASYVVAVVVGLMKQYSYWAVPFVKYDNPGLSAKEVARMSKDMMQGHRWELFVLQLSFVGWWIVGFLCCCIGLYPVYAYLFAAMAAFYEDVRSEYVLKQPA